MEEDPNVIFAYSMWVFGQYESEDPDVRECIGLIRGRVEGPGAEQALAAFEWWAGAYEAARAARSVGEIKRVTRAYLCSGGEHAKPRHNIAQGMMKATIHRLWRNLYEVRTAAGHLQPGPALLDAATPEKERAVAYMQELLGEIAAESGETTEEMMDRLAPE